MILLLDNYDSFTYNIYQAVTQLGHEVEVIRNDAVSVQSIEGQNFDAIILSPGPGAPSQAGITKELIARLAGKTPILGVCLGHQAIAEVFGGRVVRAPEPVHGKASPVYHCGQGLYAGLPQPFSAGRYHSLLAERAALPDCLSVTAETVDGLIMGLKHRTLAVEGVQFHPESVLTADGMQIFKNFLAQLYKNNKN
ncbi:MAG: aminodeoxychorismate/anthranilate synthase component II [Negativicutes bacterium]|nr:aminodeoxychorismate/anthranilate synthase component II [Negativicutes bacterium]